MTLAWVLGATAFAQDDAYTNLTPVAGDVHRHTGLMLQAWWAAQPEPLFPPADNNPDVRRPHSFGPPSLYYDAARATGYHWINLSHHSHHLVAESGTISNWFMDPSSQPIRMHNPPGGPLIPVAEPHVDGFPDFATGTPLWSLGQPDSLRWNESLSLSTLASAESTPGVFAALSGREYTTQEGAMLSPKPGEGGHKVIVLPGDTDKACKVIRSPFDCASEADLFAWTEAEGAAVIQAHPSGVNGSGRFAHGLFLFNPTLDPSNPPAFGPGGFSDVHVHGIEVARSDAKPVWELAFQEALAIGYRVFPAFGSDHHRWGHKNLEGDPDLHPLVEPNNSLPALRRGSTVCWVPSQGWTRSNVTGAMRERRCYYAAQRDPSVRFSLREWRGAPPLAPWMPMGAVVALPPSSAKADVRVQLENAALNVPLRRVEIVRVNFQPSFDPVIDVIRMCGIGITGDASCECIDDPEQPNTCTIDLQGIELGPGAYYVRACSLADDALPGTGCDTCTNDADCLAKANSPLIITAPIMVNSGCTAGLPDADGDGWPDCRDLCPNVSNIAQADFDGDGLGDDCDPDDDGDGWDDVEDLCRFHVGVERTKDHDCNGDGIIDPDPAAGELAGSQCDQDGDGVGDACDNCPGTPNSNQADGDGDGMGDECQCGDTNGDKLLEIDDLTAIVLTFPDPDCFPYDNVPCGLGSHPACDTDNDGLCDQGDVDRLLALFEGRAAVVSCAANPDSDLDGVADASDNCLTVQNPAQLDPDRDGFGSACDNCPDFHSTDQTDTDGDGLGDACLCGDANGDFSLDSIDARLIQRCAVGLIPCAELCDATGDGICNSIDSRLVQRASVGILTRSDLSCRAPITGAAVRRGSTTTKQTRSDGDCMVDGEEALAGTDPLSVDTDGDGIDDCTEIGAQTDPTTPDMDQDGVGDPQDNCPVFANASQTDTNADGVGDACQCGDQSGDGTVNLLDVFAINAAILDPGLVTPLCDTNEDDEPANCNLLDIFNVNNAILGTCTPVCGRRPADVAMAPPPCL